MVASLGGEFRRKARKGGARVAVVRGNADGSLKVTDSRVLEAGDLTAALMRLSLSWAVGFLGLFSMFRGGRSGVRAVGERKGHVGSEEHRAHEILADAGPHAAGVLVRCKDQQTRQIVVVAAAAMRKPAGMARSQSFLPAMIPVPLTTGCVRLSASPPARRARRAASTRLGRGR